MKFPVVREIEVKQAPSEIKLPWYESGQQNIRACHGLNKRFLAVTSILFTKFYYIIHVSIHKYIFFNTFFSMKYIVFTFIIIKPCTQYSTLTPNRILSENLILPNTPILDSCLLILKTERIGYVFKTVNQTWILGPNLYFVCVVFILQI